MYKKMFSNRFYTVSITLNLTRSDITAVKVVEWLTRSPAIQNMKVSGCLLGAQVRILSLTPFGLSSFLNFFFAHI